VKRLAAATAAIALLCAADAAARDLRVDGVRDAGVNVVTFRGTWKVRFFAPDGPDGGKIAQKDYDDLAHARACGGRSQAVVFIRERVITLACE
jgi:hypothetical protein